MARFEADGFETDGFEADEKGAEALEKPSRYRALLLEAPEVRADGLAHRRDSESVWLDWSAVRHALAAEVGEPEGVRTVVFDLVVGIEGPVCRALRMDADPGEDAMQLARRIEQLVGSERCSHSLRALAAEGLPTHSYPDLDSFEEAALESIRFS